MKKDRKKYLIWRIVCIKSDGSKKTQCVCCRTNNVETIRKIALKINPDSKVRLYYTEFK